jgi:iron complex outermembrane receptor protein
MKTKRPTGIILQALLVAGFGSPATALGQDPSQAAPQTGLPATGEVSGGLNADMKLEDLVKQNVVVPALSTVVNTVNRQESTVGRSPAAIFVITPEMIKRSGVRSIPEALRMAPGIDVARIDADTWAISARGFNSRFADQLLVQIDRRVVYNPTSNCIYWRMQDVVLADIERIEVIRGPGTTAWGSNAVNGVINIITKKSSDTQGALIQSGGGNQEQNFNTVRYGGRAAEDLTWRVYGQQFDRNSGWNNGSSNDSWRQQRAGFRADYTPTKQETVTLQGDIFNGYGGESLNASIPFSPFQTLINDRTHFPGGNVLCRYGQVIDSDTSWQIQSYFDRYQNNTAILGETRNTYDVDFQYQFSPAEFHQIVAGGFYRRSQDFTTGSFAFSLVPPSLAVQWASVFAQDTMTLVQDRLYFTLGTRLEQNTFGHFQVEPTARFLFLPSPRQSAWIAVSRAIRNPDRDDRGGISNANLIPGQPVFSTNFGNPNVPVSSLIAYEIGYRAALTDDFSWDIAGFINDYHKLDGQTPNGAPIVVPPGLILFPSFQVGNLRALSYGFETTATYQLTKQWRLFCSYSLFEIQARGDDPGTAADINGSSPHNQVYLRSSWDLGRNVQFDVIGRYVDRLTALGVPQYTETDMRIGWHVKKNLEVSLVGQNLLNSHHLEFVDHESPLVATQMRRGGYAMVSWTY